tara:strand:- start:876 stop:1208 length:333 start_codon:yes stop_codon:yes gene_type:complete
MKYTPLCNCLYVDQSKIIVSKKKLYTSHIGTCSILLFSYNNYNFMAHIDALQNNSKQIIEKITEYFDTSKLKNVTIFKGPWCYNNCLSTNIITYALDKLKITYNILEKKN